MRGFLFLCVIKCARVFLCVIECISVKNRASRVRFQGISEGENGQDREMRVGDG